jgi:CheY-like chemotaxis protein
MGDSLGKVIDDLVKDYEGVNVLLICADDQDRTTLGRLIRSIISTAEVVGAADPRVAAALLSEDIDLVVVDVDAQSPEALAAVRNAKENPLKLPVVALGSTPSLRDQARELGADEVSSNPPPSAEFQRLLVRALGRPSLVSGRR